MKRLLVLFLLLCGWSLYAEVTFSDEEYQELNEVMDQLELRINNLETINNDLELKNNELEMTSNKELETQEKIYQQLETSYKEEKKYWKIISVNAFIAGLIIGVLFL